MKSLFQKVYSSTSEGGRILLWVTAACLLVYLAGTCGNRNESEFQKEYAEWSVERNRILQKNDSLQAELSILADSATRLGTKANKLTTSIDSLRRNATTQRVANDRKLQELISILPDTCSEAIRLAESYRAEADTLAKALELADIRENARIEQISVMAKSLNMMQQQNDSLRAVIINVPKPKSDKFLGLIPLPSRQTSAVLGVVTGVVVTTAVISLVQ